MIGSLARDGNIDSLSSHSIHRPLNTSVLSPWHLSGDLANLVASARLATAGGEAPRERVRGWAAEEEAEDGVGREGSESSSS
jgi:hypothetical protein